MRELKTKKLFYGKWPYKVETYIKGASRVYYSGTDITLEWCLGKRKVDYWENEYGFWGHRHNIKIDKVDLAKYTVAVKPFIDLKKELKIRCEGGALNFFTDNKDLVDQMRQALSPWIQSITAPASDEELAFLMDNGRKKILCDMLPYDQFKFKVFIKTSLESTQRQRFYEWIDRNNSKLSWPDSTDRWLTGERHWAQDPFVYVEDDKTASMLLLYLGNHTKRVEEFILRDSINI